MEKSSCYFVWEVREGERGVEGDQTRSLPCSLLYFTAINSEIFAMFLLGS